MAESSGTSQVTPPQLRQLESLLWIGYSSHIPAHRAACNQIRDIWPDVSFDVVARQREIASDDQVRLICDYSRAIRAEYDTTPDQALVANLAVAYEPHRYETLRMMDRVLGRSAAHRLTVSRGARDSMLVQHLSFWGRYVDSRPESLADRKSTRLNSSHRT